MNLYEALEAENRNLERAARKLIDTTAAQPDLRGHLLGEIAARVYVQQTMREDHVYPILRVSAGRTDIAAECHTRLHSIRDRLRELRELPPDADHRWQTLAKTLRAEVDLLMQWERTEMFPPLRDVLSDEEARMYGARIHAEQKQMLHQRV
jgi:hypothetical protein